MSPDSYSSFLFIEFSLEGLTRSAVLTVWNSSLQLGVTYSQINMLEPKKPQTRTPTERRERERERVGKRTTEDGNFIPEDLENDVFELAKLKLHYFAQRKSVKILLISGLSVSLLL